MNDPIRYRFPRSKRVTSGQDFTKTLRRGAVAADDLLVVFALARSPTGGNLPTRLGITIPKKTGNAVVRNRWKRQIREAFRTRCQMLPPGYDLVVRPKKDATLNPKTIHRGLAKLIGRAIKRLSVG